MQYPPTHAPTAQPSSGPSSQLDAALQRIPAQRSPPTYAAPHAAVAQNGFQHHVPSKINTRTQKIRDGIVYQKPSGGNGGNGGIGGPGKSGIGIFKGMSTATGGAATPAQLQET
jgi:hypothetical protein